MAEWACKDHYAHGTDSLGMNTGLTWDSPEGKCPGLHYNGSWHPIPSPALVPREEVCGCDQSKLLMTIQVFPYCCGAQIIWGIDGVSKESIAEKIQKASKTGCIIGITAEGQGAVVHEAFAANGFKIASQFLNPVHSGGGILTLWFRTVKELKPEPAENPERLRGPQLAALAER